MEKIYAAGKKLLCKKHKGLNGIVVTIGLCAVALVLCLVLNTSLSEYVKNVVQAITTKTVSLIGS